MFKKISFIYKDTEIIGGGTPSTRVREYYDNGQVNWFNVVDLKQKYVYSTINKITELGVQKSAAKIFPKNSVVLGCSATIGDCCISKSKSSCKQGLFAFIPNDKIYHEYLYYVFVINKLSLKKLASGAGSTFPNINKSMLKEFEIPIPPTLEEQQAIANFLSKIDDAIEREILRIMSTQKQYYLNNMFPKSNQNIPMIRFRGFSDE
jgi:type I restriction enzyme S subunit